MTSLREVIMGKLRWRSNAIISGNFSGSKGAYVVSSYRENAPVVRIYIEGIDLSQFVGRGVEIIIKEIVLVDDKEPHDNE